MSELPAGILDRWTLPWPEIRVPRYRTDRVGDWELKRQFQPVLRGYFRGLQTATENYLLTRGGRVWMSLSPVEIESLAPHIPHMRGHVVIAGLGMGLALHNALLRPAVRRITVVECDAEVIALFDAIRGPEWPSPDRFTIAQGDALLWRPPEVPSRCVLEFVWRGLRLDEDIGSGSEVNRLVSELLGESLPPVDFAHGDLTSRK
jgi:hypothetical protein